jgi:hypothetical protein
VYNNFPLFLRVVIEIPSEGDVEGNAHAQQLLAMTMHMIDLIAGLKISKAVTDKCEKNRVKQKKAATAQKQAIE